MNTRMIDHDEAVKDLMAERYLLGELNAAERDAYEEHLFCCDACFHQVKAGTELIAELRHTGTEGAQVPLAPGCRSAGAATILPGPVAHRPRRLTPESHAGCDDQPGDFPREHFYKSSARKRRSRMDSSRYPTGYPPRHGRKSPGAHPR